MDFLLRIIFTAKILFFIAIACGVIGAVFLLGTVLSFILPIIFIGIIGIVGVYGIWEMSKDP